VTVCLDVIIRLAVLQPRPPQKGAPGRDLGHLEVTGAGACGDVGVGLAMTPREVGLQAQPFLERVTFPDSGGDDRGGRARERGVYQTRDTSTP
jgi:hypothetical protein